ncbi:hypothetical protein Tco_1095115 [Tanacetum coccineum]
MHTASSWIRRNVKWILKSFVKFFRYVPEFLTKTLLHHLEKKNWFHSFRNFAIMFVSTTQDYQQYGALIPDDMINQDIEDSQAYKTCYDFATGKVPPRKARKYKKVTLPSRKLSHVDVSLLVDSWVWKSVRYGVSKGLDMAYWSFLDECSHGYTVSSLMDTAYWSSE